MPNSRHIDLRDRDDLKRDLPVAPVIFSFRFLGRWAIEPSKLGVDLAPIDSVVLLIPSRDSL
jgi:hypothetical protein